MNQVIIIIIIVVVFVFIVVELLGNDRTSYRLPRIVGRRIN